MIQSTAIEDEMNRKLSPRAKMSSFTVLLSFALLIAASNANLTPKLLQNRNVIITAPQNVTWLLLRDDHVTVAWYLPSVYIPHDVSPIKFRQLKSGDKVEVMRAEIHSVPTLKNETTMTDAAVNGSSDEPALTGFMGACSAELDKCVSGGMSTPEESCRTFSARKKCLMTVSKICPGNLIQIPTMPKPVLEKMSAKCKELGYPIDISGGDGGKEAGQESPAYTSSVVCWPASHFANFTVGEKVNGSINDNDWAVSLLDSDQPIQVTNMTVSHSDQQHRLVKFEQGCVTKITVAYNRPDSSFAEKTTLVLNATDRLATITGLLPVTNYTVVVTAHFVSGHAISAPPLEVTTKAIGQPQGCRCDWHGTTNLTSACDTPTNGAQHCPCNTAYVGRFCEVCAPGYYRDRVDSACKRCPCDRASVTKSSCSFVQGILQCDECQAGYTGNVCHKCDRGYYLFRHTCRPCVCNNNTRTEAPLMCHPVTGACMDCQHNTTGFYCERCLAGFRRVGASCLHSDDLDGKKLDSDDTSQDPPLSPGIIAAIVFVAGVCVCALVGLFVCHRVRTARAKRAFWTVEMRPEMDDIDFNSVPNEDAHMDDSDRIAFTGGRSNSSGKYARLEEDC